MSGKDADLYTLKLKIENKRLRAEVERLHATMEQLTLGGHDPTIASLRAHRIANLEDEVERLLRPIGRQVQMDAGEDLAAAYHDVGNLHSLEHQASQSPGGDCWVSCRCGPMPAVSGRSPRRLDVVRCRPAPS